MSLRLNIITTGIQGAVAAFNGFSSSITDAMGTSLGGSVDAIVVIAQTYAPVLTGALRESIHSEQIGPMAYNLVADVDYAVFVEYGTIRMLAQPFLRPAVIEGNQLILEAAYEAIQEAFS